MNSTFEVSYETPLVNGACAYVAKPYRTERFELSYQDNRVTEERRMDVSEEIILQTFDDFNRVIINRAGCPVLESDVLPIIDVDMEGPGQTGSSEAKLYQAMFTLNKSEGIAFRIYRTRSGYRLILPAIIEPVDGSVCKLMTRLQADPRYIESCRSTRSYRARLSPKPWRCTFAAREIGVCRFVDNVGDAEVHQVHQPVLDYHDKATRAFVKAELLA